MAFLIRPLSPSTLIRLNLTEAVIGCEAHTMSVCWLSESDWAIWPCNVYIMINDCRMKTSLCTVFNACVYGSQQCRWRQMVQNVLCRWFWDVLELWSLISIRVVKIFRQNALHAIDTSKVTAFVSHFVKCFMVKMFQLVQFLASVPCCELGLPFLLLSVIRLEQWLKIILRSYIELRWSLEHLMVDWTWK